LAEQGRARQSKAEQGRARQSKAEQGRARHDGGRHRTETKGRGGKGIKERNLKRVGGEYAGEYEARGAGVSGDCERVQVRMFCMAFVHELGVPFVAKTFFSVCICIFALSLVCKSVSDAIAECGDAGAVAIGGGSENRGEGEGEGLEESGTGSRRVSWWGDLDAFFEVGEGECKDADTERARDEGASCAEEREDDVVDCGVVEGFAERGGDGAESCDVFEVVENCPEGFGVEREFEYEVYSWMRGHRGMIVPWA
jgi:hypothetical protein